MKLADILPVINDCECVTIIDQFGNRLFRCFRREILNRNIPDVDVTEIAIDGSILIIEVRTCG